MSRRQLVVVVSAGVLGALVLLAVATVLVLTRSGWGQDRVRELVQRQLASGIHGRLYVGRISGSFLNGITIDSLEIRDPEDSVFVSTGRVSVAYDPRDLMDKRVLIQRVDVEHPFVHLRQHENWQWNFREVFAGGGPSGPRTPGTHFGDFVVLDSVHVRDATFMLTLPWHPDDSLRAARRDSAIRFELSRPDKEIRRRRDGFARTWRWTQVSAVLPRVRLSDPDSAGRTFATDTLAADERDPPFSFRNVRGTLRNLGDSIWVDVAHFDLPGSTGKGRGKIWWGSDLPVRYALHIIGDSVSLADVHWVYPTLPAKGGGSMLLDIENEKDLNIMDYRLTNMDVRAARSHLKGDMTFAVGGPVLAVKDVKLTADPVDFELLRTLNGKPFPVDWQGAATGTVRARGGPLTDFVVDDAALTFRDAHVPGAVSQVAGDGGLDILNPAFTAFHGFNVRAQRVDLRTIEYLYPNFPRLGGFISGTATLDSSWLDVRFSDADVTHSDGDAPPSRITGDGRVTYGEQFMRYDLDVQADSLSLTDLRQSYPKLPFRGMVAGPVRVQGTLDSLQLDASLSGPAGSLTFAGMLDAFPADVGAHGRGRFAGLDVAQLLARDSIPAGSLTGAYTVDVQGDSLTTMHGTATLALDRSTFDRVRIFPSRAHVHLADARVHVDTLEVESSAGALSMTGALGLRADTRDSLRYIAIADSLGGLRPFLETRTAQLTGHPDSLAGTISVSGVVSGSIDTIDVSGTALGTSVYMNKDRGRSLRGSLALHDVLREPRGVVAIELDTLVLAGIRVDTIGARVQLAGRRAGHFELGTLTDNGVSFGADGRLSLDSGATNLVVEHVALNAGGDTWSLAAPAAVRVDSTLFAMDSLVLRNGKGGALGFVGRMPAAAAVSMGMRADSVPMADLAAVLQLAVPATGWGTWHLDVAGTRDHPQIRTDAAIHDVQYGSMHVERIAAQASYAAHRTDASVSFFNGGAPALTAHALLPMELTLFSGRLLDDSLQGSVRADSADLGIVEAFAPTLRNARGKIFVALDLGGTWSYPTLGGRVLLENGELTADNLGIHLRGITANLEMTNRRDSLAIHTLRAYSGTSPRDTIALSGAIAFGDWKDPVFDLTLHAHQFHAIDKHSLATLDVSTAAGGMSLRGPVSGATLTGGLTVDRGVIYMPDRDMAQKQLVDLSSEDALSLVDTTNITSRALVPTAPSRLVEHLQMGGVRVTLGDEVWLRSQEANIKLAGSLNVQRSRYTGAGGANAFARLQRGDTVQYRFALDGTLNAERGTYTLSLGPIQREFQVESGQIQFFGTPDLNPGLDITAVYNVRQYNRQDVKVRVHLQGFLYPNPVVSLESGENFAISQSDLISYLLYGAPSFEIASQSNYTRTAAQVLLPTASTVLTRAFRQQLGSWVDMFQFQAGATQTDPAQAARTNTAVDFFANARLGGEKQITNNLFFSFSAGLCQLGAGSETDPGVTGFVDQLGGTLQYRFSPTLSVDVGREPPSSALVCGRGLRGFVATPPQWGLSLSKTWRF